MNRKIAGWLVGLIIIFGGWWLLSLIVNSPALPTPWLSLQAFAQYALIMLPDFTISFYRVALALVIGTVLGAPIGLLIGRSELRDNFFSPVLYMLYPIPKIVFLPVLLVLLGLGNAPKIALIAIAVFFQTAVTCRDAIKHVDKNSIDSVRSLGASNWDIWRHVIIPSVLPDLFTALRISSGTSVSILFVAESIAGSTGLGYFIMNSWGMIDYPKMFAGIIGMSILGVIFYEVFDIAENRLTKWRQI